MKMFLAIGLVAGLLAGGGTVYAADSAAPGDALYGLDQASEQLRLDLTAAPSSRAALKLSYAEERLHEARDLASQNDVAHAEAALHAYDKLFGEAILLLLAEDTTSDQALSLLDQSLVAQQALLAEIDSEALLQDDGVDCSDGDGDGMADEFPQLPCENGVVVCTDADGNGFDDTYTGLACAQSGSREGSTDTDQQDQGDEDDEQDNEEDDEDDGAACDPTVIHPVGQRLAAQFGVSYETIMGYFCTDGEEAGLGFGDIRHAYSLAQRAGVSVEEVIALYEGGMGWGEIRQQYGLSGGVGRGNGRGNGQGGNPGRGNNQGGQAERIAAAAGVSVEEVLALRESGMGWGQIKQHYGLIGAPDDGEDDAETQGRGADRGNGQGGNRGRGNNQGGQAERIAAAAGVSVDEVLALRESGMGWGEIKQYYGLIGGAPDDSEDDSEDQDDD